MRKGQLFSRLVRWPATVGLALGVTVGGLIVIGQSRGLATSTEGFQAFHKQPVLVERGEPVSLVYDTVCAWDEEAFERGDMLCDVEGFVFVRSQGSDSFQRISLEPGEYPPILEATIPPQVTDNGFQYYAEISNTATGETVRVPDRRDLFHEAWSYSTAVHTHLPASPSATPPEEIIVSGGWGDGINEFGVTGGHESDVQGPAAFAFDPDGALVVLDRVNGRLLTWSSGASTPEVQTIEHTGGLADLAIGDDGTRFVLDGGAGIHPKITAYDPGGALLSTSFLADVLPEKLEAIDSSVVLHDATRSVWATTFYDATPVARPDQLENAPVGVPLRTRDAAQIGGLVEVTSAEAGVTSESDGALATGSIDLAEPQLVVSADSDHALFALISGGSIRSVWSITSDREIGEVQLAEIVNGRLLVVIRTWTDNDAVFEVIVLNADGSTEHFAVDASRWADSSVLGRFEVGPNGLYQLRNDELGFWIARFEIGGLS